MTAGYLLAVCFTPFRIPCVFRLITGLKCPGCGVTTLLVSMLTLNTGRAFNANPFLFITSPLIVSELIYYFYMSSKRLPPHSLPLWNNVLVYTYTAALCIFGILRNTGLSGGHSLLQNLRNGLLYRCFSRLYPYSTF